MIAALEVLRAAAEAWYAAPIGSEEESDAAGEMYRAAAELTGHSAQAITEGNER